MPTSSINFANAEAFQNYIREYDDKLQSKKFVGFKSANYFTPMEGVKGQVVMTEAQIGQVLSRYADGFAPRNNMVTFIPRVLSVVKYKFEAAFVPANYEKSYLGYLRKTGQDPDDFPFYAFILDQFIKKGNSEREFAAWRGKLKTTGTTANDPLSDLFNGINEIIKAEITATNLTPVVTGALTIDNIVDSVEAVYKGLGDAYKEEEADIFMNTSDKELYIQGYRKKYGNTIHAPKGYLELETGMAALNFVAGVPQGRIMAAEKGVIVHGYDGADDGTNINVGNYNPREISLWADEYIGFNFALINDDNVAVNDQWTA